MAEICSHLFIDEAHHISAPTWEGFRGFFADKPVLQFTATPYRGDGRQVEGTIIYVSWCHFVGAKLLDESIATERVLDHVLVFEQVAARPELVPLTISWPEEFFQRSEESIHLDIAGEVVPFYEAGLELSEHSRHGPIRYQVVTEARSVEYEMRFLEHGVEHVPTGAATVDVLVSNRRQSLTDRFREDFPLLWLEDGAILMNDLLQPPSSTGRALYEAARIEAWDWSGTDTKKESQYSTKRPDSIQYRVIQELLGPERDSYFQIVFDDDASNEAADVVAIGVDEEHLTVHLFHCKYSSESYAGGRVGDLYNVCGQAQRSVFGGTAPRGCSRIYVTGKSVVFGSAEYRASSVAISNCWTIFPAESRS